MANRNNNSSSPNKIKDSALGYLNSDAWIQIPNGTLLVEADCARDHAAMRVTQLSGLLMLMRVDEAGGFRKLGGDVQLNLMWLASQLADEVEAVLPLATEEAGRLAREACGGSR